MKIFLKKGAEILLQQTSTLKNASIALIISLFATISYHYYKLESDLDCNGYYDFFIYNVLEEVLLPIGLIVVVPLVVLSSILLIKKKQIRDLLVIVFLFLGLMALSKFFIEDTLFTCVFEEMSPCIFGCAH